MTAFLTVMPFVFKSNQTSMLQKSAFFSSLFHLLSILKAQGALVREAVLWPILLFSYIGFHERMFVL
jgi:hypothetical protein